MQLSNKDWGVNSLRAWLSASIYNRVVFSSLALTMTVVIILGSISYINTQALIVEHTTKELEQRTALSAQTVQSVLNAIAHDVKGLSENSFIANGLVDSSGRDIYLHPFLREHKPHLDMQFTLALCNHLGKALATNMAGVKPSHCEELTTFPWQTDQQIATANIIYQGGRPYLILIQPVYFLPTGTTEGALVAKADLEEIFRGKISSEGPVTHLSLDGPEGEILKMGIKHDPNALSITVPLHLKGALSELQLKLNRQESISGTLSLGKEQAFDYLVVLLITLVVVYLLTHRISKRLTSPLKSLTQTAKYNAERGSLEKSFMRSGQDEISQLEDSFNHMLDKLQQSQNQLERNVTERTLQLRETEHRLSNILNAVQDVIWSTSPDGKQCLYINHAVEHLFQQPIHCFTDSPNLWESMVLEEDRDKYQKSRVILKQNRSSDATYRIKRPNGEIRWIHERLQYAYENGNKEPVRIDGIATDITERQKADADRRLAAKVFESSSEAICITDANNVFIDANQAFCDITGYSRDEIRGKTPRILNSGRQSKDFYKKMWRTILKKNHWQGEIWDRNKNGDIHPGWLSISAIRDRSGKITNFVATFTDISERKKAEERISFLAHYDALTQLPNRTKLQEWLDTAIVSSKEKQQRLGVLFIDLDHFKNINDSLGHLMGDRLLQIVAKRLQNSVRRNDLVARLGGDEFLLVLTDIHEPNNAANASKQIIESLSKSISLDNYELSISPSIGISLYPQDGEDQETLIKNADAAMYHAKETGRNNYKFFNQGMNKNAFERLNMEVDLRQALEQEDFILHYQPQLNIVTGNITGMEALIRWKHPEKGLIPPNEFIPIAEDNGLIRKIGKWVLETACKQNYQWQLEGIVCAPIAVNLSAMQFIHEDITKVVMSALEMSKLEPRYLELELTESVLMQHDNTIIEKLNELKNIGVKISIDDFGTGYSSLNYLKRFPINKLKIDRSFIRDVTIDPNGAAITSAIISMAHSLNLDVIAEGVETEQQLAFLREEYCDEFQGYYFSEPVPAEKMKQILS